MSAYVYVSVCQYGVEYFLYRILFTWLPGNESYIFLCVYASIFLINHLDFQEMYYAPFVLTSVTEYHHKWYPHNIKIFIIVLPFYIEYILLCRNIDQVPDFLCLQYIIMPCDFKLHSNWEHKIIIKVINRRKSILFPFNIFKKTFSNYYINCVWNSLLKTDW